MESTVSNIYSVDIYGQLHLEPSTAACSFYRNLTLIVVKMTLNSCNSLKSLLFHRHYIRLNTDPEAVKQ